MNERSISFTQRIELLNLQILAKKEFCKELINRTEKNSLVPILRTVLLFDWLIVQLRDSKDLNLNTLKYIIYKITPNVFKSLEPDDEGVYTDFLKFAESNLSTFQGHSNFMNKIRVLESNIDFLLGSCNIDIFFIESTYLALVQPYLEQNQKQLPDQLEYIVLKILLSVIQEVCTHEFCFEDNSLVDCLRISLITSFFFLTNKPIDFSKTFTNYPKICGTTPGDVEKFKRVYTLVLQQSKNIWREWRQEKLASMNPFLIFPPEITLNILEYLVDPNANFQNLTGYKSLLRFGKTARANLTLSKDPALWKEIFNRTLVKHGLLFSETANPYQGFNNDTSENYSLDFLKKIKQMRNPELNIHEFLKSSPVSSNFFLQHLYFGYILDKDLILNFKVNQDNKEDLKTLISQCYKSVVSGNQSALFTFAFAIKTVMEHSSVRRFCPVVMEAMLEADPSLSKTDPSFKNKNKKFTEADVDAVYQQTLAKINGFVFDGNVPEDVDVNAIVPWFKAFIYHTIKAKDVFLRLYKNTPDIGDDACYYLTQCSNPESVVDKIDKADCASLLQRSNKGLSIAIKYFDDLDSEQTKVMFQLDALVFQAYGYRYSDDIVFVEYIFSQIKKITVLQRHLNLAYLGRGAGSLRHFAALIKYLNEENIVKLISFKTWFENTYVARDKDSNYSNDSNGSSDSNDSNDNNESNENKRHNGVRHFMYNDKELSPLTLLCICFNNIEPALKDSKTLSRLLAIFTIKDLINFFPKKGGEIFFEMNSRENLLYLLSDEGFEITELLEKNRHFQTFLYRDFNILKDFVKEKDSKFVQYLLKHLETMEHYRLVKTHTNIFLNSYISLSAIPSKLSGTRLQIFNEFPRRFDHWKKKEFREFFSTGGRVTGSIFTNEVLLKLSIFIAAYEGEIDFKGLKEIAESRVLEKVDRETIENFLVLYNRFLLPKIIELNETPSREEKPLLLCAINLTLESLTHLLEFVEGKFEQFKYFIGSSLFSFYQTLEKAKLTFFKEVYISLGHQYLEGLLFRLYPVDQRFNLLQIMFAMDQDNVKKNISTYGKSDLFVNVLCSFQLSSSESESLVVAKPPAQEKSLKLSPASIGLFFAQPKRKSKQIESDSSDDDENFPLEKLIKLHANNSKEFRRQGNDENADHSLMQIKDLIDKHLQKKCKTVNNNNNTLDRTVNTHYESYPIGYFDPLP